MPLFSLPLFGPIIGNRATWLNDPIDARMTAATTFLQQRDFAHIAEIAQDIPNLALLHSAERDNLALRGARYSGAVGVMA